MKQFLNEVRNLGFRGAISSEIISTVYQVKSKIAITKAGWNGMRLRMEYGKEDSAVEKEEYIRDEKGEEKYVSDSSCD